MKTTVELKKDVEVKDSFSWYQGYLFGREVMRKELMAEFVAGYNNHIKDLGEIGDTIKKTNKALDRMGKIISHTNSNSLF